MLERALKAKGRSTREVQVEDHERQSVESEMVRYRFGPWDHRYRLFLNILIAEGARIREHRRPQGRHRCHRVRSRTGPATRSVAPPPKSGGNAAKT
jgi:hypothetical protein